jgi:HAD superfamily hydrolase (TIGR01509 family)
VQEGIGPPPAQGIAIDALRRLVSLERATKRFRLERKARVGRSRSNGLNLQVVMARQEKSMGQKAVMLGAVGVLAEVSEVQRAAFNDSFKEAGLSWHWDKETYREMLEQPGGKARIARYAADQGEEVDVQAVYDGKVKAFETAMKGGVPLREGIADVIATAQQRDMKLAFVTGTNPRQVEVMLNALSASLDRGAFDYIGDGTRVEKGKPAPDLYLDALQSLGVDARDAIAIEDTPESARAAVAAHVKTIGFPGPEARDRSFGDGVTVVENLDASVLDF